jgi:hypothetical protein
VPVNYSKNFLHVIAFASMRTKRGCSHYLGLRFAKVLGINGCMMVSIIRYFSGSYQSVGHEKSIVKIRRILVEVIATQSLLSFEHVICSKERIWWNRNS